NKRLEESMAAKRGRLLPPAFEQLSKSNLGSLKVSVFGRSRNVSPPSSTPASFSSWSSMSSKSLHSDAGFVLPKRIGRKTDVPFKPAGRSLSVKSKERERRDDSPSLVQVHDTEAKRFLDEPMQQDPFLGRNQTGEQEEEDCTMLNSELQPIFNNNEATEGLLGEAMPEGLDPEEILWETTEAFT
ncbi:hypothetical protein BGZ70_006140, partial [Mortierella alpina]